MTPPTKADVVTAIREAVRSSDPENAEIIREDTLFDEVGLDSLVLVDIAVRLQRTFNVYLTEDDIAELGSAGSCADRVLTTKGLTA